MWDDEVVFVFIQLAWRGIEIEALRHFGSLFAYAGRAFNVKLYRRGRVVFGEVYAFEVHIPLCRHAAGFLYALDGDFLDKPLVVGLHRVEAIDHIVDAVRLVRGRIAERQEGIKLL